MCGIFRYSTPGGYSSKAVRPIALAKVMSIAQMMKAEFPSSSNLSLSGIGGVETGNDAAEYYFFKVLPHGVLKHSGK
jgi:dihydropyrimidine dehydrogenase (NADP+)